MWAMFTLNISLVRKLWQFHGQPIQLLLTCCNMLQNLGKFVSEISLQTQLETYKNEFGELLTKLLDEGHSKAVFRCSILFDRRSGLCFSI